MAVVVARDTPARIGIFDEAGHLQDVWRLVERFDRRGIEQFELFRSEFGNFGQIL